MILSMVLVGLVGISKPAVAQDTGSAVPAGTTLSQGELAVWADASVSPPNIYAGYADGSFTVDGGSYNAWAPYDDYSQAIDGACRTAESWISSFGSVNVNDTTYTDMDSCLALEPVGTVPDDSGSEQVADDSVNSDSGGSEDNLNALTTGNDTQDSSDIGEAAPMVTDPGVYTADDMAESGVDCREAESAALSIDSTDLDGSIYGHDAATDLPEGADVIAGGKAIPAGVCINSGLIVVRINHFGVGGQEDVRPLQVGDGLVVYCGKRGKLAFDCWENYVSVDDAAYAACEQAVGDLATLDVEGAFNYRFSSITFTLGDTTYQATDQTVCR